MELFFFLIQLKDRCHKVDFCLLHRVFPHTPFCPGQDCVEEWTQVEEWRTLQSPLCTGSCISQDKKEENLIKILHLLF